jgi:hypothetical protein
LKKDENYLSLFIAGAKPYHCRKCSDNCCRKKADSVARLAIKYMNANQADSVYALTGPNFRSQIPAATWVTVSTQLAALPPFTKTELVKSVAAVNVYKLTGKIVLTYNVSIDSSGKINDFAFVPYQE